MVRIRAKAHGKEKTNNGFSVADRLKNLVGLNGGWGEMGVTAVLAGCGKGLVGGRLGW
jgi:hypothetical protein